MYLGLALAIVSIGVLCAAVFYEPKIPDSIARDASDEPKRPT